MPGLVSAATAGNLDEVNIILDNGADINAEEKGVSPLSAALMAKQWKAAQLLIKRGAKVMALPIQSSYCDEQFIKNPFLLGLFASNWDPETLTLLLSKTPKLALIITGFGVQNIVDRITTLLLYKKSIDGLRERLDYLLHEALIRADREILTFISTNIPCPFSAASVERYIILRNKFTPDDIDATKLGLDFLLKKNFISDVTALEIQVASGKMAKFEMSIDVFPAELKNKVAKKSKRSLLELFCELQHYLNPSFPLYPIDSEWGKQDEFTQPIEEIRKLQDIGNFRAFLNLLDTTSFLAKIARCSNDLKDDQNPAALLMAEILLHHGKDKVIINGKEEVFLNNEQLQTGVLIIKRFYSLSSTEKLFLTIIRDQQLSIEDSKSEISELKEQVAELNGQLKKTNGVMESFSEMLKQIHIAVGAKKEKSEDEPMKSLRTSNGLFS